MGKRFYKYNDAKYKKWRTSVFRRDAYTCQLCGGKGNLEAHHILRKYDYPSLVYKKQNGITLCTKCHKAITGSEYYIAPLFESITKKRLTTTMIKDVFDFIRKYNKPLYKYIQKNIDKISTRLTINIQRQKSIKHGSI